MNSLLQQGLLIQFVTFLEIHVHVKWMYSSTYEYINSLIKYMRISSKTFVIHVQLKQLRKQNFTLA